MSFEAMRQIQTESRAHGLDRAIAMAIAYYANPTTGISYPSNKVLMSEWGFSERTLQTALRTLEDLGDLRRQPTLETHRRRRVYLVGSGQLPIFDEWGQNAVRPQSRARTTAVRPQPPARVEGTEEPLTAPPNPPASGGERTRTPHRSSEHSPGQPRVAGVERAAGARRRHRRRRPDEQGSVVASEPCPLHQQTASAADPTIAEEVWLALEERLRHRLGERWEVWGAGAHPHRLHGDTLVIALAAPRVPYVTQRFGGVLAELRRPGQLALVGCEALT